MEQKEKKKWLVPLIVCAAVIVVIIAAIMGIKSYMTSRSVVLTTGDILATVSALSSF